MENIGFVGAGNMAEALVRGLIVSGLFVKDRVIVSDISRERLEHMSSAYGIKTTPDNREVAKSSKLIVLAVKPDTVSKVAGEIKDLIGNDETGEKILISIAAGIPTSRLAEALQKKTKLVRVMPNTPALSLAGASVIYASPQLTAKETERVKKIFECVGTAYLVKEEKLLDAVTGLSGSGPAFAAMFIEALSDGGVKMGLPRDMALGLATQTVYGAAKMIIEDGIHPAVLKDMVSSPSGTTIHGIHELETGGFRGSVISAVQSGTRRSKEIAKEDE